MMILYDLLKIITLLREAGNLKIWGNETAFERGEHGRNVSFREQVRGGTFRRERKISDELLEDADPDSPSVKEKRRKRPVSVSGSMTTFVADEDERASFQAAFDQSDLDNAPSPSTRRRVSFLTGDNASVLQLAGIDGATGRRISEEIATESRPMRPQRERRITPTSAQIRNERMSRRVSEEMLDYFAEPPPPPRRASGELRQSFGSGSNRKLSDEMEVRVHLWRARARDELGLGPVDRLSA